ncbi:membrane protein PM19L-like [Hibiscus syriacus]|uniref:membrane protein PM19L-like n=1 Tax=Hibiscus syriacus TaxID=106335 RepID=UPI0019228DBE|nr:membrane protein PM19L-like [Hibiscus syriacus]
MATHSGRACRSLMPTFLAVNMVVYLIILGLADLGGNPSTSFMLIFGLIGSIIGACSVIAGLFHHFAWTYYSFAASASSAIVSWAVTALAFGLVCKEIVLGGHRGKRLVTKFELP